MDSTVHRTRRWLTNSAGAPRPTNGYHQPTCRAKVGQEVVKDLVRLIIQRHFFELTEKQFIFIYAAQSDEQLELHTIVINDGLGKTSRTFGVGKYAAKEEKIPPDFSAIEDELKRLKDSAFPPDGKPCHFAPAIKFREVTTQKQIPCFARDDSKRTLQQPVRTRGL